MVADEQTPFALAGTDIDFMEVAVVPSKVDRMAASDGPGPLLEHRLAEVHRPLQRAVVQRHGAQAGRVRSRENHLAANHDGSTAQIAETVLAIAEPCRP